MSDPDFEALVRRGGYQLSQQVKDDGGEHRVDIVSDGPANQRVIIDGVDISDGVTSWALSLGDDQVTRLELTMVLPDATRAGSTGTRWSSVSPWPRPLVALGWSPPTEAAK